MATASSSLVYIDVPFLGVDWKKMSLGASHGGALNNSAWSLFMSKTVYRRACCVLAE